MILLASYVPVLTLRRPRKPRHCRRFCQRGGVPSSVLRLSRCTIAVYAYNITFTFTAIGGRHMPRNHHRSRPVLAVLALLELLVLLSGTAVAAPKEARADRGELIPAFDSDFPVSSVGTPATNGEVSTQATTTCTIFASDPRKEGGVIAGDGSQACGRVVDQAITVTLQQYRGFGVWRNKAQVHASGVTDFLARRAAWRCDGTGSGTQTYRIVTDGRFTDLGGATYSSVVQSANYLRVFCT